MSKEDEYYQKKIDEVIPLQVKKEELEVEHMQLTIEARKKDIEIEDLIIENRKLEKELLESRIDGEKELIIYRLEELIRKSEKGLQPDDLLGLKQHLKKLTEK